MFNQAYLKDFFADFVALRGQHSQRAGSSHYYSRVVIVGTKEYTVFDFVIFAFTPLYHQGRHTQVRPALNGSPANHDVILKSITFNGVDILGTLDHSRTTVLTESGKVAKGHQGFEIL